MRGGGGGGAINEGGGGGAINGGGGGGATKGGGAGAFASSTLVPSSWTPSFSSSFRSLSEGDGIDCDQLDIPTDA